MACVCVLDKASHVSETKTGVLPMLRRRDEETAPVSDPKRSRRPVLVPKANGFIDSGLDLVQPDLRVQGLR